MELTSRQVKRLLVNVSGSDVVAAPTANQDLIVLDIAEVPSDVSRITFAVFTNQDGAASGVVFESNFSKGDTNYDTVQSATYAASTGLQIYDCPRVGVGMRIHFIASGTAPTVWRGEVRLHRDRANAL